MHIRSFCLRPFIFTIRNFDTLSHSREASRNLENFGTFHQKTFLVYPYFFFALIKVLIDIFRNIYYFNLSRAVKPVKVGKHFQHRYCVTWCYNPELVDRYNLSVSLLTSDMYSVF